MLFNTVCTVVSQFDRVITERIWTESVSSVNRVKTVSQGYHFKVLLFKDRLINAILSFLLPFFIQFIGVEIAPIVPCWVPHAC